MAVHLEHDFSLLHEAFEQHLGVEDGGVQAARRVSPLAVEVHASQVATLGAVDHPVDI